MPRLTNLEVHSRFRRSTRRLSRLSPRFLAGLPRLKKLFLWNVLDMRRWDDNINYIVGLTELCQLCLMGEMGESDTKRLTAVQVQPLTALGQLDSVMTNHLWDVGHYSELTQALKSLRHERGLPPTKFQCYW